jgi:hypothetical protein
MAVCAICGTDLPRGACFCPNCVSAVAEAQRRGRERKLLTVLFADVTGSTRQFALDRAAATFERLRATKSQRMLGNMRGELEG